MFISRRKRSNRLELGPQPPQIITPPVISGTVEVGQTLTATAPVWSDADTSSTDWLINSSFNNTSSLSATDVLTYEIQAGDLDNNAIVGFYAYADNSAGFSELYVYPPNSRPVLTNNPSISGFNDEVGGWQVGDTVGVTTMSWLHNPTLTYQWYYVGNDEAISGATASTLTLPPDSQIGVNEGVYVIITGTNAFGSSTRYEGTGNNIYGTPITLIEGGNLELIDTGNITLISG
jgi:hypothetical protein